MDFFKEPYPFQHQGKELLRIFFFILVIGFLFEYFLIPFERTPDEHNYSYLIISLFHIGVAALTYLLLFAAISHLFEVEDWTVGKETLSIFFALSMIGLNEWLIRDIIYNNPKNWNLTIMWEEIWHAYLSGGVIMVLVITLNFNFQKRRNLISAKRMSIYKEVEQVKEKEVLIKTGVNSDDFMVSPKDILCVKSDGNYCEFFLKNGTRSEKILKRITLQSTADQLTEFRFIVKTHRAYLVNTRYILGLEGNAAGYKLNLESVEFSVPVSRAHIQEFNARM